MSGISSSSNASLGPLPPSLPSGTRIIVALPPEKSGSKLCIHEKWHAVACAVTAIAVISILLLAGVIPFSPTDVAGGLFILGGGVVADAVIRPIIRGRQLLKATEDEDPSHDTLSKIKDLLERGANPNYISNRNTPLMNVSRMGIHNQSVDGSFLRIRIYQATKLLLLAGANPNARDPSVSIEITPLYHAVQRLDLETAKILIESRATINPEVENAIQVHINAMNRGEAYMLFPDRIAFLKGLMEIIKLSQAD